VAMCMERRLRVRKIMGVLVRFMAKTCSSSVREGSTGPR